MIYLFVPYYHPNSEEFINSLAKQTEGYRLIKRDRKRDKIYWTKACNDFLKDTQKYRGIKDNDIICIMNNDISFGPELFTEGSKVKQGEVYLPEGVHINWKYKKFIPVSYDETMVKTFPGRCFFMTYGDFKKSGGFSKLLPHYLSDYDFGIKMLKKLKPVMMRSKVKHTQHPQVTGFNMVSVNNPIFWTIFLIKHFNRYTFINIAKAWYDSISNWFKK